jgi:hypothetical protein
MPGENLTHWAGTAHHPLQLRTFTHSAAGNYALSRALA